MKTLHLLGSRPEPPRLESLALVLLLTLASAPAQAQFCLNNSIYLDLSDEPASFPICHDGVLTCQEPSRSDPAAAT